MYTFLIQTTADPASTVAIKTGPFNLVQEVIDELYLKLGSSE